MIYPLSLWERAGVRGLKKDFSHKHPPAKLPFLRRKSYLISLTPALSQRERGSKRDGAIALGGLRNQHE
jgi:hypothetical protein